MTALDDSAAQSGGGGEEKQAEKKPMTNRKQGTKQQGTLEYYANTALFSLSARPEPIDSGPKDAKRRSTPPVTFEPKALQLTNSGLPSFD